LQLGTVDAAAGNPSGGTLAAAAPTLNCIYDRDIDYGAHATDPSGRVQPHALLFAIALQHLSFTMLAVGANLLSALLAMSDLVYMLVYTHWLKRHSTQNIVIGGAAGAIPPLVGWVYWDFKLGSG